MNFQSVVKQGSDLYFLYSFLKRLTTPFEDSNAFQLGIIDEKGKVLKKRRTLKTAEERDAYTLMDTLIFNLKKIMAKVPFGNTKLMSYAASLFLLKEQKNFKKYALNSQLLEENFEYFLKERNENKTFIIESDITYSLYEQLDFITEKKVKEDAPANATGTAVAGTGDDSSAVVIRKKRKKIKDISIEDKDVMGQGSTSSQRKNFATGFHSSRSSAFKNSLKKAKVKATNR